MVDMGNNTKLRFYSDLFLTSFFLLLFPYDTRLLHISYSRNLSILYDTKFHSKKQDKFIRLMPDFCPTEPYAGYPKTAPLHFSPPRPYSSAHQPREEQISGGDGGCSGSLLNRYSVKSRDNTVLPHTPSERKMQGFPPDTDWAGLSVRRFLSCGKAVEKHDLRGRLSVDFCHKTF